MNPTEVDIKVFTTGYCVASENLAISSGKNRKIKFHANCVWIDHPQKGGILFDTGYAPRFFEVTQSWPEKLQRYTTPSTIEASWSIASQLHQMGIAPEQVQHLVISHFHADHICGIKDFPQATFYAMKSGYKQIESLGRFAGVRKGLIKKLLPEDISNRIQFFDAYEKVSRKDAFEFHYDFWGDGSIKVIQLPGHARGQIGLILNEGGKAPYFLAADGFWLTDSLDQNILPSKLTGLIIDSWKAYAESFQKIRTYRREHPDTPVISCHCPRVYQEWALKIY